MHMQNDSICVYASRRAVPGRPPYGSRASARTWRAIGDRLDRTHSAHEGTKVCVNKV